jgi:diadenosine tetraphosphate (Ap4A) HIT family hydrolase
MTAYDDNNIFARILRREIPCNKLHEDDHTLAFRDIHPQAPTHILVIPKGRYMNVADFGANATAVEITSFWRMVAKLAEQEGLESSGFRVITNAGINGGQEVPHFHAHILGGRKLGPMVAKQS